MMRENIKNSNIFKLETTESGLGRSVSVETMKILAVSLGFMTSVSNLLIMVQALTLGAVAADMEV